MKLPQSQAVVRFTVKGVHVVDLSAKQLRLERLGDNIPYQQGMDAMRSAMDRVRNDGQPTLLLLQHSPTITTTRTGGRTHLKESVSQLELDGIQVIETDRGGDLTFHGPGQLVGYPVIQLPATKARLHLLEYVRRLEEALIQTCSRLGVVGCHRKEGLTGVWVSEHTNGQKEDWVNDPLAKKLVAIGVGVNRHGVTRHGFALNMDIDLAHYTARMVPCGLVGRGVTSLAEQLPALPPMNLLERILIEELQFQLSQLETHTSSLPLSSTHNSASMATINGETHG